MLRIGGDGTISREAVDRVARLVALDTPLAAGPDTDRVQLRIGACLRACWVGMGLRVARGGAAAALGKIAEISFELWARRQRYNDIAVRSVAAWGRPVEQAWASPRLAFCTVSHCEHAAADHDGGVVGRRHGERGRFRLIEVVYTPADNDGTGRRTGSTWAWSSDDGEKAAARGSN